MENCPPHPQAVGSRRVGIQATPPPGVVLAHSRSLGFVTRIDTPVRCWALDSGQRQKNRTMQSLHPGLCFVVGELLSRWVTSCLRSRGWCWAGVHRPCLAADGERRSPERHPGATCRTTVGCDSQGWPPLPGRLPCCSALGVYQCSVASPGVDWSSPSCLLEELSAAILVSFYQVVTNCPLVLASAAPAPPALPMHLPSPSRTCHMRSH